MSLFSTIVPCATPTIGLEAQEIAGKLHLAQRPVIAWRIGRGTVEAITFPGDAEIEAVVDVASGAVASQVGGYWLTLDDYTAFRNAWHEQFGA